jgi:hypothetical protein
MKKIKILFLVFASVFVLSACNKKDDEPSIGVIVQQGKWKITLFSEDGFNETQYFNGYEFTFTRDGIVTASKNGSSVIGSWSAGTDDRNNKLILDFNTVILFQEMNEDWRVLEKSSTKIHLEHVSGDDGEIDLLTFERI